MLLTHIFLGSLPLNVYVDIYIYIVFIFIYYASNTDELLTDKRLSNVRMPSSKSRKCNIQRDSISDFQDPSLRVSCVLLRAPLPAGHASRLEEEGLKKTGGYASSHRS